MVERILLSLPERFSGLTIHCYVLMSTHLHVILAFYGMKEGLPEAETIRFEEFYKSGSDKCASGA